MAAAAPVKKKGRAKETTAGAKYTQQSKYTGAHRFLQECVYTPDPVSIGGSPKSLNRAAHAVALKQCKTRSEVIPTLAEERCGSESRGREIKHDPRKRGQQIHKQMESSANNTTAKGTPRIRKITLKGRAQSAMELLETKLKLRKFADHKSSEVEVIWPQAGLGTRIDQRRRETSSDDKHHTVLIEMKTFTSFQYAQSHIHILKLGGVQQAITPLDAACFQLLFSWICYEKTYPSESIRRSLVIVADKNGVARAYELPAWILSLKEQVSKEMASFLSVRGKRKFKTPEYKKSIDGNKRPYKRNKQ